MTLTTPTGSWTISDVPGLKASGVGTFSGCIHEDRLASVWSTSLTVNPISVSHASARGLPKSAANASSSRDSRSTSSARSRSSVVTRHE